MTSTGLESSGAPGQRILHHFRVPFHQSGLLILLISLLLLLLSFFIESQWTLEFIQTAVFRDQIKAEVNSTKKLFNPLPPCQKSTPAVLLLLSPYPQLFLKLDYSYLPFLRKQVTTFSFSSRANRVLVTIAFLHPVVVVFESLAAFLLVAVDIQSGADKDACMVASQSLAALGILSLLDVSFYTSLDEILQCSRWKSVLRAFCGLSLMLSFSLFYPQFSEWLEEEEGAFTPCLHGMEQMAAEIIFSLSIFIFSFLQWTDIRGAEFAALPGESDAFISIDARYEDAYQPIHCESIHIAYEPLDERILESLYVDVSTEGTEGGRCRKRTSHSPSYKWNILIAYEDINTFKHF